MIRESASEKRRTLQKKEKKNLQKGSWRVNVGAVLLLPPKAKTAHYTLLLTAWVSKAEDTLCIMILCTSISPFIWKSNQWVGGGWIREWNVALTLLLCISCCLWLLSCLPLFFSSHNSLSPCLFLSVLLLLVLSRNSIDSLHWQTDTTGLNWLLSLT